MPPVGTTLPLLTCRSPLAQLFLWPHLPIQRHWANSCISSITSHQCCNLVTPLPQRHSSRVKKVIRWAMYSVNKHQVLCSKPQDPCKARHSNTHLQFKFSYDKKGGENRITPGLSQPHRSDNLICRALNRETLLKQGRGGCRSSDLRMCRPA